MVPVVVVVITVMVVVVGAPTVCAQPLGRPGLLLHLLRWAIPSWHGPAQVPPRRVPNAREHGPQRVLLAARRRAVDNVGGCDVPPLVPAERTGTAGTSRSFALSPVPGTTRQLFETHPSCRGTPPQ